MWFLTEMHFGPEKMKHPEDFARCHVLKFKFRNEVAFEILCRQFKIRKRIQFDTPNISSPKRQQVLYLVAMENGKYGKLKTTAIRPYC